MHTTSRLRRLALTLALILAACGSSSGQAAADDYGPPSVPIEHRWTVSIDDHPVTLTRLKVDGKQCLVLIKHNKDHYGTDIWDMALDCDWRPR